MASALSDHEMIERIHAAWIAAEIEGRPEAIAAFCHEDIAFQPPIGPAIVGRRAILDALSTNHTPIERITIADMTIEVCETLAVKRARFTTKLAGVSDPVVGSHLWVLRPRWTVTFVTWSLDRPPG